MNKDSFKAMRLRKGMTQEQFADLLGVSYSTVAAIETGRRRISDKVRAKLAQEVKIDENFLNFFDLYMKIGKKLSS